MRQQHLSKEEIRHFVERAHDEIALKLFLHHLAVCPGCYAAGGYVLDLYLAGSLPAQFSLVDVDLAQSRAEAPGLFSRLSGLSFTKQKGLLKDIRKFRSWGLAELLCAESLVEASKSPGKTLELSELAVLLASLLGPWEPAEEDWLFQLRAYAYAHLGNARRVVGELRSAEGAFSTSDEWWKAAESMGDVLDYEAKILALKASLRRTQGRFSESLELLERALSANGAEVLRPEILANRAFTLGEAGDLEGAVRSFREAIAATDRATAPRKFYLLHHNLLDTLSKAGQHEEAHALLAETATFSEETGDELDRVRFQWIEARVLSGVGDRSAAVDQLGRVRRAFLERGLVFDAALAGLELAAILLMNQEHDAVVVITEDLLLVFSNEGVPRETLATLSVFCHAAQAKIATVDLAVAAREAIERAHNSLDKALD